MRIKDDPQLMFFLTPARVAKRRHCGRTTVIRAILAGELKASIVKTGTGREFYGITVEDADKWVLGEKKIGRPRKRRLTPPK